MSIFFFTWRNFCGTTVTFLYIRNPMNPKNSFKCYVLILQPSFSCNFVLFPFIFYYIFTLFFRWVLFFSGKQGYGTGFYTMLSWITTTLPNLISLPYSLIFIVYDGWFYYILRMQNSPITS